jgi:hypothetical protein
MRTRAFVQLMVYSVLVGCAPGRHQSGNAPSPNRSAILIRGSEMSGSVIESMRTRIPTMRISTGTGPCPRIVFRGQLSVSQANPSVYVDGTLTSDTCALNEISPNDIDFVEIYPSGDTPRATIRRNPSGLILIFRRRE